VTVNHQLSGYIAYTYYSNIALKTLTISLHTVTIYSI